MLSKSLADTNKFKYGGDLEDMHQTLHAFLQVGQFERAQALLHRFNEIYKSDAPGLVNAHIDYIREATLKIMQSGSHATMRSLQAWFEVDHVQHKIPPNATVYALMIQASIRGAEPKAKGRSIRRYMHLAKQAGILQETMALVSGLDEVAEVSLRDENWDGFLI